MPDARKYSGTLAVDGSGDGTLTLPSSASDGNITGALVTIRHISGGGSKYADSFSFTVTGAESGRTLYAETIATTATFERNPEIPTHEVGDGTEASTGGGPPWIVNEKLVITVASGGASKTGDWEIYIV